MKKIISASIILFVVLLRIQGQSFQKNLVISVDDAENVSMSAYELSDHTFYIVHTSVISTCNVYQDNSSVIHINASGDILNYLPYGKIFWHDKLFFVENEFPSYYLDVYNETGIELFSNPFDSIVYAPQCFINDNQLCGLGITVLQDSTVNIYKTYVALFDSTGNILSQKLIDIDTATDYPFHAATPSADGGLFISKYWQNGSISHRYISKYDSQLDSLFQFNIDPQVILKYKPDGNFSFFKQLSSHQKIISNINTDLDTISSYVLNDAVNWISSEQLENNEWLFLFTDASNNLQIGIEDSTGNLLWQHVASLPLPDNTANPQFISRLSDNSILYIGEHNISYGGSSECFPLRSTSFACRLDTNSLTNGISLINNLLNAEVFPNPFSESTIFRINKNISGDLFLEIFDMTGKSLEKIQVSSPEFEFRKNDLSDGIYFYKIMNNDQLIANGKLIIIN